MVSFSHDIKDFVLRQKLGYVATISPDNTPNLSPKGTIMVLDDDKLVFADIRSPNTIRNLNYNPNLELNVIDPITRKGFRFKGTGKVLTNGIGFSKILDIYEQNGVKSKINSLIIVQVTSFQEVTSPLYDLGYSEDEIKSKMKKHYGSF